MYEDPTPGGDPTTGHASDSAVRTVLVYVRTAASVSWLSEVLPEVLADSRVRVVFTVEDARPSGLAGEAIAFVRRLGGKLVPWGEATAAVYDLVLASHPRGSFDELRGPLLLLPHGPGFGKSASVEDTVAVKAPAPSPTRPGQPPLTVGVTHPGQISLLARLQEGPGADYVVVGDPVRDSIVASRLTRHRHRAALGVSEGQRLVLLSSTWGPSSQFARHPDLWRRLAAELPVDDYRLAVAIHPNVFAAHGSWQVRTWMAGAADAGVAVVSPGPEWRSAAVAADVAVTDHGSVGLYAAVAGAALLLAGFAAREVHPGTPNASLGRLAPALDLRRPLEPQIARAAAANPGEGLADLLGEVFAEPGQSLRLIRSAAYRLMGLGEPVGATRLVAVALPPSGPTPPISHLVDTILSPLPDGTLEVAATRRPAALPPPPPPPPPPPRRAARKGPGTLRRTRTSRTTRCCKARPSSSGPPRRVARPPGTPGGPATRSRGCRAPGWQQPST